jgi:CubicO group peptidase (beta-lactamase class C family)
VRRLLAVALAVALLLAGCREGDPPAETDDVSSAAPPQVQLADPEELGFDPKALERAADRAEDAGSTCFLVARDGQVVVEDYWNGGSGTRPQEVFSVTKSVTSTLVGLAQADGDLSVEDRASDYIPEWRRTPSKGVTVRNLLSNDSGRYWTTESDYGELIEARNRTAYAVGLGQAAPPGTVWAYNNAAIQTLDAVIRNATGTATHDYAQARLFEPLGMSSTRMTLDASRESTQVFFGMQSTCPDLERFGRLFAQDGEWDGEQLIPQAWVEDAVGRSSQELNAAYGLLWWVNRTGPLRDPVDSENPGLPPGVDKVGQLVPGAPEEMYAALGLGGQVVLVDPGSGVVVVRLGTLGAGAADNARSYSVADAAKVLTEALVE